MPSMVHIAAVAAGGGLGAAARLVTGNWVLRLAGPGFPYGTMVVNIAGSLLMGLLIAWLSRRGGTGTLQMFLATGVLGGFTTFSAFSLDVVTLWERGATGQAAAYVLASVVLSIAALFAGLALMRTAG